MSERNVITIGYTAQCNETLTLNASQFYSTDGEDGVIFVNFDKSKNENRIIEELNTLISQEENELTGDNINRIQELLNKLPFEEKRIEMSYRKDEILKLLKNEREIEDIGKSIDDKSNITKVQEIFLLMNKYMEISMMNKNRDLKDIEDKLIKLHNDKFLGLLNKENFASELIGDNIEKYEELKYQIEKLQNNIKFVLNAVLKNVIMNEINELDKIKSFIENNLTKLLKCEISSLEHSIKLQKLINTLNNSDSPEQIDKELIENNFVDYINLGQKGRRKALAMFMHKNSRKYSTMIEVNQDLDIIVLEIKKHSCTTDTIET